MRLPDIAHASLIAAAIQAPSSHNTQPWQFAVEPGAIRLHADRTRALPVNDPDDRELTISCGCALFNLRAAAAAAGQGWGVARLPDGDHADLLALLTPGGAAEAEIAPLAAAIPDRRTWRKPFDDAALRGDIAGKLAVAAGAEGAWLALLDSPGTRQAASDLVAEGDAAQWGDRRWRRELAQWMHPRRAGDGLSLPGMVVPAARAAIRGVDMGRRLGAQDAEHALAAPLLAVLGTPGDNPADWLAAGQALERVLLVAASAGLQASYLNQPVQVAALRPRLAGLCGGQAGFPQAMLRLGPVDDPGPPAPRRPIGAVLTG